MKGWGSLTGPNEVTVDTESGKEVISAKNIVIATGSDSINLPFLKVRTDARGKKKFILLQFLLIVGFPSPSPFFFRLMRVKLYLLLVLFPSRRFPRRWLLLEAVSLAWNW